MPESNGEQEDNELILQNRSKKREREREKEEERRQDKIRQDAKKSTEKTNLSLPSSPLLQSEIYDRCSSLVTETKESESKAR